MITALLFLGSAVLLIVAAELFTNAVEWAGFRLRLGSGATGSLLAAIGTSLPETIVPAVALATRTPSADAVATGAVLGAPFLLATIATSATGLAVLLRRGSHHITLDRHQPRRDLGVFLGGFSLALLCIVLPYPVRVIAGALLLTTYGVYAVWTLRSGTPKEDMPEPLHFVRWIEREPHGAVIASQLVVAVLLLIAGSQLFVSALSQAAAALSISPLILAIIVVPLATELPESLNSVLWIRTNDDGLAFGNVAGSMAWQATLLAFIGVVFTSWQPTRGAFIGALLTLATGMVLYAVLWRGRAHGATLLVAAVPWLGFVIAQVVTGGHLGG